MATENTSGVNHVTIRSPSVGHVRPGLGRVLAWGAGVCLLGPAILAIPMMVLKLTPLYAPLNALLPREWLWSLTTLGYRVGLALAVLSAFASGSSWPRPQRAMLAVDKGELQIRHRFGRRRIKKERITGGIIVPSKPTPTIHIHLRGGDTISAVVNSEAEAERALEALGIGADRRRAVVTIGSTDTQMIAGASARPSRCDRAAARRPQRASASPRKRARTTSCARRSRAQRKTSWMRRRSRRRSPRRARMA